MRYGNATISQKKINIQYSSRTCETRDLETSWMILQQRRSWNINKRARDDSREMPLVKLLITWRQRRLKCEIWEYRRNDSNWVEFMRNALMLCVKYRCGSPWLCVWRTTRYIRYGERVCCTKKRESDVWKITKKCRFFAESIVLRSFVSRVLEW